MNVRVALTGKTVIATERAPVHRDAEGPVWRYFPELLRYPLQADALAALLPLAALFWLLFFSDVLGLILLPLAMAFLAQFLLGAVQTTALGQRKPPPVMEELTTQPSYPRLAALAAFFLGSTLLMALLAWLRATWLAGVLLFIAVLLLPVFIAVLALADDWREAGNPLRVRHFIAHTHGGYFALALPAALLATLAWAAGGLTALSLALLASYAVVAACHLLGFSACRHYAEMNTALAELQQDPEAQRLKPQRTQLTALLADMDTHLHAHDARTACDLMFRDFGALADPLRFHEELYAALQSRRQNVLVMVQGKRLIHLLMQERRVGRALTVYGECLDVSGFFQPWDLAGVLKLAESALQERRLPLFDKIAASIVLQHPGSPEAVALQYRRARYLAEIEHKEAEARKLLKPLLAEIAHPLHARILALYRTVGGRGY